MSHRDDNLQATPSTGRCLVDLTDGECGTIRVNHDRKSAEMGLYPGVRVRMFRNRKHERSLVICAGEARFLVSRAIAKKVELEG
jgi:Fe2+ transport system protein FeoA